MERLTDGGGEEEASNTVSGNGKLIQTERPDKTGSEEEGKGVTHRPSRIGEQVERKRTRRRGWCRGVQSQ